MTFFEDVYSIVARIPRGKVLTYGAVARLSGNARAARAVGMAMKHNTDMKKVPCHRVVASDGSMCGYSGKDGVDGKIRLLQREGVRFIGRKVDLTFSFWKKR